MSIDGVLAINHRELVLSGQKKTQSHFLRLPHDLQDQIIQGMDLSILTLHKASALALEHGFRLSHEAISSYYRIVRRRRAELLLIQSQEEESAIQYRRAG